MSANALFACYDNHFPVDGADFDGTNDYMHHASDLTGVIDGKAGTISAWIRLDGGDGTLMYIAANNGGYFMFERLNTNTIVLQGRSSLASTKLLLQSASSYTTSPTWLHIIASWNLATAQAQLYINDASDLLSATVEDETINYTSGSFGVGALTSTGTGKFNGCIADLWFSTTDYIDLSVTANRRKFISASGKPVFLGSDGSVPTGTAPAVYLHLADGEAASSFATNRGTGGDFTITGSLDTASSSPSD